MKRHPTTGKFHITKTEAEDMAQVLREVIDVYQEAMVDYLVFITEGADSKVQLLIMPYGEERYD